MDFSGCCLPAVLGSHDANTSVLIRAATCLLLEKPSKCNETGGTLIKNHFTYLFLFQGFIRLDMSEFQERHEVSKWAVWTSRGCSSEFNW